MKELEVNEINLLNPDLNETNFITMNMSDDDIILTLSNPSDIAQLNFLMENYIIKHMKSKTNNTFLKELKKTERGNYNMRKHVKVYYEDVNFKILNELDNGVHKLINAIDDNNSLPIVFINDENYSNVSFIDLLFLYNLITNKDSAGGNRQTNFFKEYISKSGSLAEDFYTFQTELDNSEEFYNELNKNVENESFRKVIYYYLFGKTDKLGNVKATLKRFKKGQFDEDADSFTPDITLSTKNKYYTLFDNVEKTDNFDDIVSLYEMQMKNSKINPKTNCK